MSRKGSYGLESEKKHILWLGCHCTGTKMSREDLLINYIRVQSNNGRSESWWSQAVDFARECLLREYGIEG